MFENMMKILVFTVLLFSVLSVVCAQDTNNHVIIDYFYEFAYNS